jgi:hypothetical protein
LFDVLKAAPLARLGYRQYTSISHVFDQVYPLMPDDLVSGAATGGAVMGNEAERLVNGKKPNGHFFT